MVRTMDLAGAWPMVIRDNDVPTIVLLDTDSTETEVAEIWTQLTLDEQAAHTQAVAVWQAIMTPTLPPPAWGGAVPAPSRLLFDTSDPTICAAPPAGGPSGPGGSNTKPELLHVNPNLDPGLARHLDPLTSSNDLEGRRERV